MAIVAAGGLSCGSDSKPEDKCADCYAAGLGTFACFGKFAGQERYVDDVCVAHDAPEHLVDQACIGIMPLGLTYSGAVQAPCNEAGSSGMASGGSSSATAGGSGGGSGLCDGWDPGEHIVAAGSIQCGCVIHNVQAGFVGALLDEPLMTLCDDARFADKNGPGFEVVNADPGELLYELGLRNGDVPKELNGYKLRDFDEVAHALADLYFDAGENEYELLVRRGNQDVMLYYHLEGCLTHLCE
jgi:hypothetical protein